MRQSCRKGRRLQGRPSQWQDGRHSPTHATPWRSPVRQSVGSGEVEGAAGVKLSFWQSLLFSQGREALYRQPGKLLIYSKSWSSNMGQEMTNDHCLEKRNRMTQEVPTKTAKPEEEIMTGMIMATGLGLEDHSRQTDRLCSIWEQNQKVVFWFSRHLPTLKISIAPKWI